MNSIPAQDIERRGISAVDEALHDGPVHVIKNNRPSYVVLTEAAYTELLESSLDAAKAHLHAPSVTRRPVEPPVTRAPIP